MSLCVACLWVLWYWYFLRVKWSRKVLQVCLFYRTLSHSLSFRHNQIYKEEKRFESLCATDVAAFLPWMALQGSDNLFPMMLMLNNQNPSASPMSPMSSMSSMWPLLMSGSDSARNAMLMSHFMQGMGGPAPVV